MISPLANFFQGSSPWPWSVLMSADIMGATAIHLGAAELTPGQADWLVKFLAVLAFLLGIAVAVKQLISKPVPPVPTPQPLLVQLEKGFVKREEFEELKTDVHNLLKDMRAYLHEEVHKIQNSQNAAVLETRNGFDKVRDLISAEFKALDQNRRTSVARLHDDLSKTGQRLAAVEQLADSLNQSQHSQDTRIDGLLKRRSS